MYYTYLLQGVVDWVCKDPAERKKWLPILLENINLDFLKSQKHKWLSILEEKNLLLEDIKNIIDPTDFECDDEKDDCEDQKPQKMMRHNALEEVTTTCFM